MEKKISVVIPTNRSDWRTKRAIDSVKAQTLRPYEIIVVCDGVRADIDWSGITTVNTSEGKAGLTRNLGVFMADGDYIAFLDCDDFWEPQKLHVQSHFLDDHDVVLCDYYKDKEPKEINFKDKTLETDILKGNLKKTTPGLIIKRELFIEIDGYENLEHREDHLLLLKLLKKTDIYRIKFPLWHYTDNKDSTTSLKKMNPFKRLINDMKFIILALRYTKKLSWIPTVLLKSFKTFVGIIMTRTGIMKYYLKMKDAIWK